jgi:prepilin signal peptidase PulO-like enzyme (type II secretory pathway)
MEQIATLAAAAVAGWCLGWLSAFATNWLQKKDDLPSAKRGPLLQDPFVQATCAVVWVLAKQLVDGDPLHWVAAGVIAVPLIQVAVTDLRHRYVYTAVAIAGALIGVALGWLVHPGQEWWYGLVGAAGGFMAFLIMYLLGLAVSRLFFGGLEPLATGDITIAMMVGAGAGACTLNALFLGVLASGLIAVGVLLARHRFRMYFAYGPGLCLGGLITLFRC